MKKNINYKGKIFVVLFLSMAVIIMIAIYVQKVISPTIDELAKSKAQYMTNKIIDNAVAKKIDEYSELYILDKNTNGEVVSAKADSQKIAKLKVEILGLINDEINEIEKAKIPLYLISVFKQDYFGDIGPTINIRLAYFGSVKVDIENVLEEKGINQVRYAINLIVKTDVNAYLASRIVKHHSETKVPLTDVIISGSVPMFFSQ